MKAGLAALYDRKDAASAVVEFRRVLGINPDHYGATFQLAKALDQAGKARRSAARSGKRPSSWRRATRTSETVALAKERLARRP